MPTGTGKTVTVLSLVTSYQYAHPDCGKLVYCTRTVPEMTKAVDELKRVIEYRKVELLKDAHILAEATGTDVPDKVPGTDILAVCLSSRRNLYVPRRPCPCCSCAETHRCALLQMCAPHCV